MQAADPFAPNVVVDLLYAAMAVKQFDAGLETLARAEKTWLASRISTSRAACFT